MKLALTIEQSVIDRSKIYATNKELRLSDYIAHDLTVK